MVKELKTRRLSSRRFSNSKSHLPKMLARKSNNTYSLKSMVIKMRNRRVKMYPICQSMLRISRKDSRTRQKMRWKTRSSMTSLPSSSMWIIRSLGGRQDSGGWSIRSWRQSTPASGSTSFHSPASTFHMPFHTISGMVKITCKLRPSDQLQRQSWFITSIVYIIKISLF